MIQKVQFFSQYGNRLEVCGGMASGKTTLVKLLESKGFPVVYERYWENPYLNDFYASHNQSCVFETEMVFTLLHYTGIVQNPQACFDYSIIQDLAYADVNMPFHQLKIYNTFYSALIEKLFYPRYLIYLKCSIETALERLKMRDRENEQFVDSSYMEAIVLALENRIQGHPNVLILDSEKMDFFTQKKEVLEKVNGYYKKDKNMKQEPDIVEEYRIRDWA